MTWPADLPYNKKIAIFTGLFIVVAQVLANVVYFTTSLWSLSWFEWNLLVLSGDTSVGALYWALKTIYTFEGKLRRTEREIDARLRGHYGPFFEVVQRIDGKLNELPKEKKEKLADRLESFVDRLIEQGTRETEPRQNPLLEESDN